MRTPLRPGARVRVSLSLGGVYCGKTGAVVSRREVKTDGRGVPTEVSGAYKPVNWSRETAVRLDGGELVTVFSQCLTRV